MHTLLLLLAMLGFTWLFGVAFVQNSSTLLQYPQRMVQGDLTNASAPAAGIVVTAALFGLASITDIICGPVQIAGVVNVSCVIAKYDPVTSTIFFFYGNDNVAEIPTQLVVITGNIASAIVVPLTVYGTPIAGT
jgi:hypothetical protein